MHCTRRLLVVAVVAVGLLALGGVFADGVGA